MPWSHCPSIYLGCMYRHLVWHPSTRLGLDWSDPSSARSEVGKVSNRWLSKEGRTLPELWANTAWCRQRLCSKSLLEGRSCESWSKQWRESAPHQLILWRYKYPSIELHARHFTLLAPSSLSPCRSSGKGQSRGNRIREGRRTRRCSHYRMTSGKACSGQTRESKQQPQQLVACQRCGYRLYRWVLCSSMRWSVGRRSWRWEVTNHRIEIPACWQWTGRVGRKHDCYRSYILLPFSVKLQHSWRKLHPKRASCWLLCRKCSCLISTKRTCQSIQECQLTSI